MRFTDTAAELGRRLDRPVTAAAPTTVSRHRCGTHHTAALLVAAGENIDRLNSADNRQANRALHMIVIVGLRNCERARSYMDRRLADRKTKKEAIRCHKRVIARELYRTLRADLTTLT